ncbi:MAG: nuclear transport factor 2 family protein, partial [Rubrobacteraceae bacterium]
MQETIGLDFEVLRRAIEGSDAEALIGLYADDVEVRIVNKNTPPSMPCLFRGKESIAEMLRDVCGRNIKHRIEDEVVGEERIAFNEACEYPDGAKVLAA